MHINEILFSLGKTAAGECKDMKAKQNDISTEAKKQKVIDLTSGMLHKHYCENDLESFIPVMDDRLSWFGAGENEYAVGTETVIGIFRQFAGLVPKCNITDEHYDVIEITPEVYLCTGRAWITTDPSLNMFLQVHQRVSTLFRWVGTEPRCCHIHISNPYVEMTADDVGFPAQMAAQSYEYLKQCIDDQKKQIAEQTALLERMSFEDTLTGLFNRNKFNHILSNYTEENKTALGVACFDINGLKEINDRLGHIAGDDIIYRMANHINKVFFGKAFRIGGDEFVVVDEEMDENAFRTAVSSVCRSIEQDGLSSSVGLCWRGSNCNIQEQFDAADKRMYENKTRFYLTQGNDRRKR